MHSLLLAALLASAPPSAGTQLVYEGTLIPVKDDGNPAVKKFTVSYVVLSNADAGGELAWVLSEEGRGGWLWLDRFGRTTSGGPALLYEREDGKSIVPLIGPLLAPPNAEVARGAEWTAGGLDHRVAREVEKAGRECWEIEVRSPYGHKRSLWVEQDSGLIVSVRETVFMGQGQEHKLALDLKEAKTLDAAALDKTTAAIDSWTKLREQLGWKSRSLRTELNDQQIATLKTELPKLAASPTGLLAAVAEAAAADAQGQKNRAGAIAALRERAIGRQLGEFKLANLSGKPVAPTDLAGKIVVLHFWEYRDTPLEEPYGQTGYLDYLHRRQGAGVAVYGVQVEEQLADEQARRAATSSARKLKAFMNLSYPILQDDGTLLKQIGDPRQAGGKLPLFVIIGADGKIAEYHAGLYEVKTNEGLAELSAAINRLMPKK
jgi:peroxiredoxin